jgi:transcriptional regulator GlxA family with amidase domain
MRTKNIVPSDLVSTPIVGKIAPIEIGFLLYEGLQPIDLSGPWQTFTTANEEAQKNLYLLKTYAKTEKVASSDGGLIFEVQNRLENSHFNVMDTIIVPGGPGAHSVAADPSQLEWLRSVNVQTRRTCSVCTGAFVLAGTGLVDQQRLTTHWRASDLLRQMFPQITVCEELIYCESGKFWSSAGVTAGIDLALALVEQDFGSDLAQRVAKRLVVYLRRDGDQRQYSQLLRMQDRARAPFHELIFALEKRLDHGWTVTEMADFTNMSLRTFQRKFTMIFGVSPLIALNNLRRERANLLAQEPHITKKALSRHVKL